MATQSLPLIQKAQVLGDTVYSPMTFARLLGISKQELLEKEAEKILPLSKRNARHDRFYRPEDVISPTVKKDFSTLIPIAQDLRVDSGIALYNDEFVTKPMLAEKSAEGVAAGGMAREDENTRIWNDLLAPKGLGLIE